MKLKKTNQRWGVFGGSFDPPHLAHLLGVLYALEATNLHRVLIIPCYIHPFQKELTPFYHRVEMCKLAFGRLKDFVEISEIEKGIEGINYTIDTIIRLKQNYPSVNFHLIIGSDILDETSKWKDFERIRKEAPLIILPRPSFNKVNSKYLEGFSLPPFFLPDINATTIRNLIKSGESVSQFLSPAVAEYIQKNNIYS